MAHPGHKLWAWLLSTLKIAGTLSKCRSVCCIKHTVSIVCVSCRSPKHRWKLCHQLRLRQQVGLVIRGHHKRRPPLLLHTCRKSNGNQPQHRQAMGAWCCSHTRAAVGVGGSASCRQACAPAFCTQGGQPLCVLEGVCGQERGCA
jgi:hypothetical protein